jgi:hypothetical protein
MVKYRSWTLPMEIKLIISLNSLSSNPKGLKLNTQGNSQVGTSSRSLTNPQHSSSISSSTSRSNSS